MSRECGQAPVVLVSGTYVHAAAIPAVAGPAAAARSGRCSWLGQDCQRPLDVAAFVVAAAAVVAVVVAAAVAAAVVAAVVAAAVVVAVVAVVVDAAAAAAVAAAFVVVVVAAALAGVFEAGFPVSMHE